ncbi:MAG: hypothetical protein V4532_09435 [Pseudomonadota bacterium]
MNKDMSVFIHLKNQEGTHSRLDFLLFIGFVCYLLSLVFEGPVRYALVLAHAQTFLYLRDAIAVASIIIFLFKGITNSRPITEPCTIAIYLLFVHLFIAIWLGNTIFSILFSSKLFLTALYGLSIADQVHIYRNFLPKLFIFLFIGTVAGIIANYFIGAFPWEGELFESAFGAVKSTKVWWSGGERRLSGFARASYSAALIIGVVGGFMLGHYKSITLKIVIFIFGTAAIYLSTSKGMIMAFGLAWMWATLTPQQATKTQGSKILPLLAVCCILIPIVASLSGANPNDIRTVPGFISSFWDRIAVTWPTTFGFLKEDFGWLIGKGLGGAGSAVMMGNNYMKFTPIDNYFWYLYSVFGIVAFIYFIAPIKRTIIGARKSSAFNREFVCILIVMITYGITTALFEDAFFGIIYGVLSAWPYHNRETNAV